MSILLAATLIARVTVIVPKDGMDEKFEAGYRRHLQWHRDHRDPFTWYGWSILSGERLGWFVDATLDHTENEIDAPVAPAEDSADNANNVEPYARFASSALYRMRSDLCSAAQPATPFASMIHVRVKPAQKEQFESALRARTPSAICMELASGGERPSYLFIAPRQKFSAAIAVDEPLPMELIESMTVEALKYRPDLTYIPQP